LNTRTRHPFVTVLQTQFVVARRDTHVHRSFASQADCSHQ